MRVCLFVCVCVRVCACVCGACVLRHHLSRASFELVGSPEIKLLSHKSAITTFQGLLLKTQFFVGRKNWKYSPLFKNRWWENLLDTRTIFNDASHTVSIMVALTCSTIRYLDIKLPFKKINVEFLRKVQLQINCR